MNENNVVNTLLLRRNTKILTNGFHKNIDSLHGSDAEISTSIVGAIGVLAASWCISMNKEKKISIPESFEIVAHAIKDAINEYHRTET